MRGTHTLIRLLPLLLCLAIAGCAGDDSRTSTSTVTTTVTVGGGTAAATGGSGTKPAIVRHTVSIYLVRGEQLGVAHRSVVGSAIATAALRELIAAPSAADSAAGLVTTIPAGTRVRGVTIAGGTATVDLSGRFASGGGSLSMLLRVAQVVHTLTQFDTVQRVAFELDGRPVTSIGGEGVRVSPPVGRGDFEGQAPAILVEDPAPGDAARSPLRVSGTANVFEAVLFVELRDGARVLATRRVMATSGTGTRGSFATSIDFASRGVTTPMLIAYSRSPRDGTRENEVRIPLRAAGPP